MDIALFFLGFLAIMGAGEATRKDHHHTLTIKVEKVEVAQPSKQDACFEKEDFCLLTQEEIKP